jgi:hypothetical protein
MTTLLAEMGSARSQGPADQPCCTWLGLAPTNDLSGSQGRTSRTMQTRTRAAQACRRRMRGL